MKPYKLEDRLIEFAVMSLSVAEKLPLNYAGKHLGEQLIRSGTSPALNYGEAQASETPKAFSYKLKVCLKELRETQINLKIIQKKELIPAADVEQTLQESGELVAIFTSMVKKRDSVQI